jgi:hypothetical protein
VVAGAEPAAYAGAPLAHLADELVAQHRRRRAGHEVVVVELGHHRGEVVAVLTRVEVGPADAAPEHAQDELALGRLRVRQLDDGQLGLGAGDRPHRGAGPGSVGRS